MSQRLLAENPFIPGNSDLKSRDNCSTTDFPQPRSSCFSTIRADIPIQQDQLTVHRARRRDPSRMNARLQSAQPGGVVSRFYEGTSHSLCLILPKNMGLDGLVFGRGGHGLVFLALLLTPPGTTICRRKPAETPFRSIMASPVEIDQQIDRLPALVPVAEFCWTNTITSDVALVQIQQLGFDDLDKTLLIIHRNPAKGKRLDPGGGTPLVHACMHHVRDQFSDRFPVLHAKEVRRSGQPTYAVE